MQTLSYEPDTLYFNVRMTNNNNNNPFSVPASYDSTSQNTPLIGDPSKYYITITDFSCPGESIPIAVARIVPNQGDANLMTSRIGVTINNNLYQVDLLFESTTNLKPPVQNKPYQVITPYYYIYSYQPIIDAINVALRQAIALAGFSEGNGVDPTELPLYPYFYINYGTEFPKIRFVVPKKLIEFPTFKGISINNDLVNYLGGFNYKYKQPNTLDFVFIMPLLNLTDGNPGNDGNPNNNSAYYLPYSSFGNGAYGEVSNLTGVEFITFTQQNYLLPQWNCLSKIIIYTQSIPVRNQQTTSRVLDSPDIVNKYPILFSFTPDYETSSQARNYIYYAPKESYLLTEMLSNSPLYKIQLSIGWVDHNGEVFPLYLNPFQSCTVQLAFMKKDLYKSVK